MYQDKTATIETLRELREHVIAWADICLDHDPARLGLSLSAKLGRLTYWQDHVETLAHRMGVDSETEGTR